MIKLSDLRIGNIIGQKRYDGILFELKVTKNTFLDSTKDINYITKLTGICISEKILLAFGFESFTYYSDKVSYRKGKYVWTDGIFEMVINENTLVWLNTDVKYVHQLQNVWYFNTNQEVNNV